MVQGKDSQRMGQRYREKGEIGRKNVRDRKRRREC